MDEKNMRQFLSCFDFKNRKEGVNYIIETIKSAESTNKILEFTDLLDDKFLPNPILDKDGKLLFDTKSLIDACNEWVKKIQYVNTEIATLVRENYLIMRDIAKTPLKEIK